MDAQNIVSWIVFAAIVVCSLIDQRLGIRAMGVAEAGFGVWVIWKRKIPYGIAGRPPSGYLSGWLAVVAGLVAVLLGAIFIAIPESIEHVFAHSK